MGPFSVVDSSQAQLVADVVARAVAEPAGPVLVYALHVGGLNARKDAAFVRAMNRAAVVYADGGSVVGLAKAAGARSIERAPTTDIGWQLLRDLGAARGRPLRIALLGGPKGLAERAGAVLQADAPVRTVFTDHGFHDDWSGTLDALGRSSPDVVLVGMGAPAEMIWCEASHGSLPAALVLTCGGWFGHLVGDERRAPRMLKRSGIEWVARLIQSPRRLGPRYARGLFSTVVLLPGALRRRRSQGGR